MENVEDKDYLMVIEDEEDEELAKKARNAKIITTSAALLGIALLAGALYISHKEKTKIVPQVDDGSSNQTTYESIIVDSDQDIIIPTSEDSFVAINDSIIDDNKTENTQDIIIKDEIVKSSEEVENNEFTFKEVDYSNVATFYNHIIENRNKYGSFAESFQSEEDVKNFINFVYNFDELYAYNDSTIRSQEDYDAIIRDYYKSCVRHDVLGQLHLLFKDDTLAQKKLQEAEELAYDLKNGSGKDYTIANKYYTWFGVNLCDGRTNIDRNTKNAPLIDGLREQYEQYRYSGNMLNARKYQKNDSLPIEGINMYYSEELPEGMEVVEVQNSYSCPDWGIDNIVSKSEEDTETRLVKKENGIDLFKEVDDAFDLVLGTSLER
ncbi:MAG: hypothetical protein IJ572_05880 [Bacilli bacterium]|nr:hypothetical protein [Bacilli bacterium]